MFMFNNNKHERAQKRRVSQRSEAGPRKFTRRSIDTVSGIKVICFFVKEMSLGHDRQKRYDKEFI